MSSEAKGRLASAVRGLRERLLAELHDSVESAYRLSVPAASAGLDELIGRRRERLESWLEEQARTVPSAERAQARARFRRDVEQEAAYTLLNRLIVLRLLEAAGLSSPNVVTGGWESPGYRELRRDWAPGLCEDATEGYGLLLQLLCDEWSHDLPGLFGDVGLTALVPVPASTLRATVAALDDPALASCWTDETTLGWVYQYWNDPQREALDAKLNDGGKLEPHEIAAKTQMFTERYMVEWALQNALGAMWLATCKRHGWVADVQHQGVLEDLDARRADWRARRDAGEVSADALLPTTEGLERRWRYYVPQPIPPDAIEQAPESFVGLKLLDPACGSGHFLVLALDLLLALCLEERRHRGMVDDPGWSEARLVETILEDSLHGIDLDPRAVQIAAAALLLAARTRCPAARPRHLHLVASNLRLGELPDDDEALVELCRAVRVDTGLDEAVTREVVHALAGADHLGTLLKVGTAVDDALRTAEAASVRIESVQVDLVRGAPPAQTVIDWDAARESVHERLVRFLEARTGAGDLGLRLRGEQLASGVRFVRLLREGQYDLVVGNPPYQGTTKLADAAYVKKRYPRGKADLYAAFLQRGLELVRPGGVSALLTMRNWMFIKQYAALRTWLLERYDLRALCDLDRGAFDEVPNDVLAVTISVFRRARPCPVASVALLPTPLDDSSYDRQRTRRKRAAVLAGVGRYEFGMEALAAVPESPVIYWWSDEQRRDYSRYAKLGETAPALNGMSTQNNARFLRLRWEVAARNTAVERGSACPTPASRWAPYIKGAEGREWFEDLRDVALWRHNGLEVKVFNEFMYRSHSRSVKNESKYFVRGVAFSMIGGGFAARVHRYRSVFGHMGASVFPGESALAETVCHMNSGKARQILAALNPGLHFLTGDVNRLPLLPVDGADAIFARVEAAFTEHEQARETSVEFHRPGPSPWRYAQDWAQRAVDRPASAPLPPWEPVYDAAPPEAFVTFALGVALGRFDADGAGILDEAPAGALPGGVLFLSAAGKDDDLDHPACAPLHAAWDEHGPAVSGGKDGGALRAWLRKRFFSEVHRTQYEGRPIVWPLSSARRSFVALVAIHRFEPTTLRRLLAEHLKPEQASLTGRMADLREARVAAAGDPRARRDVDRRYEQLGKLADELGDFIEAVEQCAERGPPRPDGKTPAREVDAVYTMDLDDGVMVNSSALWPLLAPQWKEPRKWWKELALAKGRKNYDWSHLAARYFPDRVDGNCKTDPSLAVAHGCFWRYHRERAFAWELRLQHEIGPDFTLDEADSDERRAAFLADHPALANDLRAKSEKRRERKANKEDPPSGQLEVVPREEGP